VQCRKEKFITDTGAMLELSADTLLFDTVFTTIGSTTQVLKLYNRHNESIRISSIELQGGSGSQFRMAVDGINGTYFEDVEILANDSIYAFVEVTVDPGGVELPFVIEDNIHIITNGNEQVVNLAAWGQDAYFHGGLGGLFVLGCADIWTNDKPHVVYGIVAVDSACTLTILQGTQVHVHSKSGMYVYKGVLNVEGQLGEEVVFQGDRLEPEFANVPGQWGIQLDFLVETGFGTEVATITRGGIWLFESTGSVIDYAILKNGTIGIQADTTGATGNEYALVLRNTKIQNMSAIGLWAQGSEIAGYNNLIVNCGQACGAFTIGGRYTIDHTTFANYWSEGTRTAPAFVLTDYYEDIFQNIQLRPLEEATFRNCIMWGNNATLNDFSEFVIDLAEEVDDQSYFFERCIVDTELDVDPVDHWLDMRVAPPMFIDPAALNFLPSGTPSQMTLGPNFSTSDLAGVSWEEVVVGCYTNN